MLEAETAAECGAVSILRFDAASELSEIADGDEMIILVVDGFLQQQQIDDEFVVAAIPRYGEGEEDWRLIGALTPLFHAVDIDAQSVVATLEGTHVFESQRKG